MDSGQQKLEHMTIGELKSALFMLNADKSSRENAASREVTLINAEFDAEKARLTK